MHSILSKLKLELVTQKGARPPAAVEIAPEGVLAAALPAKGKQPIYAYQPLPVGALVPGIGEPNLRDPEAITKAIRSVLGQISPRTRAITLILPDTSVRVFLLDFDSLPSKTDEVYSVLRFRLRKMVPFDIEHAGLSYQIQVETKSEVKVLVAVIPEPTLQEYEDCISAAGYEAGSVLPSSLAAMAGINSMEAVLTANLTGLALTTAIVNGQDLLLYRTLDLPEDPDLRLDEVRRGIAVAAAYYEDKLQARPSRLLYSGDGEAGLFASWIAESELEIVDLAPRPETGAVTALGDLSFAGVVGALAEAG